MTNRLRQRNTNQNSPRVVELKRTEMFSGPLPHPDILHRYETILPGAAERILVMAEHQSLHRIDMEKKVIQSDIESSKRGQLFGFVIAIVGLTLSFVLILMKFQLVGTILGGVTLVSLVSVFVAGSKTRSKERLEKDKRIKEVQEQQNPVIIDSKSK